MAHAGLFVGRLSVFQVRLRCQGRDQVQQVPHRIEELDRKHGQGLRKNKMAVSRIGRTTKPTSSHTRRGELRSCRRTQFKRGMRETKEEEVEKRSVTQEICRNLELHTCIRVRQGSPTLVCELWCLLKQTVSSPTVQTENNRHHSL